MITLIFGAGASFGSGGCFPSSPPLGKDLFANLLELGGAFSRLDSRQKDAFMSEGFEVGMATVANDSREINPLQKELACYLSRFSVYPDNAYVRLFNKLTSNFGAISIATLNYDLLIEQALSYHRISFDYNCAAGSVPLMKIHGSSNFLPDLGGLVLRGNVMVNCGTFVEGLRTNAVVGHSEVSAWCSDVKNSDISPILAMYEKGKRVVINRVLIDSVQRSYADVISKSSRIVIVGAKYVENDAHVWHPLEESHADILLVDPFPEAAISWLRSFKVENKYSVVRRSFYESVWEIAKFVKRQLS